MKQRARRSAGDHRSEHDHRAANEIAAKWLQNRFPWRYRPRYIFVMFL